MDLETPAVNWAERWLYSMRFMDDLQRHDFLTRMIPQLDNPAFGVDKDAFLLKAARISALKVKQYVEENIDDLAQHLSYETKIAFGWAYYKALANVLYDRVDGEGNKIPDEQEASLCFLKKTEKRLTVTESVAMAKYLENIDYPAATIEQSDYQSYVAEKIAVALCSSSQQMDSKWRKLSLDEQGDFFTSLCRATDYAMVKSGLYTEEEVAQPCVTTVHEDLGGDGLHKVQGLCYESDNRIELRTNESFQKAVSVFMHERAHFLSARKERKLPENHPHKSIKSLGECALTLFRNNIAENSTHSLVGVYWDQPEERFARSSQTAIESMPMYRQNLDASDIENLEKIFADGPTEFDFINVAVSEAKTRLIGVDVQEIQWSAQAKAIPKVVV